MQRFWIKIATAYKEPLGGQMAKIMGKLKHTFNAFLHLQTKFFLKQCVIWSFLPSFNQFHHNFHILQILGTFLEQITMKKKVTTTGMSH